MQLSSPGIAVGTRLALSIAALLAVGHDAVSAGDFADTTEPALKGAPRNRIEFALLSYNETGRVRVLEPVLRYSRDLGGERTLRTRIAWDGMSGASPNGVLPSTTHQTFTSPSGHSYGAGPGEQPRRSFRDTRFALGLDLDQPLGHALQLGTGLSFSKETDYLSLGGSLTLALDLDQRRTTLNLGISGTRDTVDPSGGRPVPLGSYGAGDLETDGSAAKSSSDLLFGVTRILNERMVLQLNASLGRDSGYLTEPYKGVAVVDGTTGESAGSVHESRPEERRRRALFGKLVTHLGASVLHSSLRWYHDDWGVTGWTTDLAWYWRLGEGRVLRPHLRGSFQTAADFHRWSVPSGQPLPDFVSADMRLGELDSWTAGLKYSLPWGPGVFSTRVEYMLQVSGVPADQAPGGLGRLDVSPDLDAWMFSFGYDLSFHDPSR